MEEDKKVVDILRFTNELAQIIYKASVDREDSILQQATRMQTAFSFIITSVFMAATILIDHKGKLTDEFLVLSFSSIIVVLLISILFATIAQNRKKTELFPNITEIQEFVYNNAEYFETEEQRYKYITDTYAKMQKPREESNDYRVKWVMLSMITFYIAIALCFFWFIVGIIKII